MQLLAASNRMLKWTSYKDGGRQWAWEKRPISTAGDEHEK